jgi:hypothetical protein
MARAAPGSRRKSRNPSRGFWFCLAGWRGGFRSAEYRPARPEEPSRAGRRIRGRGQSRGQELQKSQTDLTTHPIHAMIGARGGKTRDQMTDDGQYLSRSQGVSLSQPVLHPLCSLIAAGVPQSGEPLPSQTNPAQSGSFHSTLCHGRKAPSSRRPARASRPPITSFQAARNLQESRPRPCALRPTTVRRIRRVHRTSGP